jgi:hypothetical protein
LALPRTDPFDCIGKFDECMRTAEGWWQEGPCYLDYIACTTVSFGGGGA